MIDKVNEHPALIPYKDQMVRLIHSMHPDMDVRDIEKGVIYSIEKRFKNFDLRIQNNYMNRCVEMTMLEMADYIAKRDPIITSYGTMFKKHESSPNPMANVIQGFLDQRSKDKAMMFKYPKNSEMFEYYNLLQGLDKIDANGVLRRAYWKQCASNH